MRFKLSSGDVSRFKCLISLGILYGIMSVLVYMIVHTKHIKPLDFKAPLDRFSEARAIEHVRVLAQDIGGRQEGTPGLKEAARYIRLELEKISERAGPDIRIEIEETVVAGIFKMLFLGRSLAFRYRNHTKGQTKVPHHGRRFSDFWFPHESLISSPEPHLRLLSIFIVVGRCLRNQMACSLCFDE